MGRDEGACMLLASVKYGWGMYVRMYVWIRFIDSSFYQDTC